MSQEAKAKQCYKIPPPLLSSRAVTSLGRGRGSSTSNSSSSSSVGDPLITNQVLLGSMATKSSDFCQEVVQAIRYVKQKAAADAVEGGREAMLYRHGLMNRIHAP